MLPDEYRWIIEEFEPEGDPLQLFTIGQELEAEGNLEGAATVYDRAYGLAPTDAQIRRRRVAVLNRLSVTEHGLAFRYIPGGSFLMGCDHGEPDEQPYHPVWLSPFWLSETPISWGDYCALMNWEPPPAAFPRNYPTTGDEARSAAFHLHNANKIRLQYCEDHTLRAGDWHAHDPVSQWQSGGQVQSAQAVFGDPQRSDPAAPWRYQTKPMIAVAWQEADELAERLSTPRVRYALPSEAQWEMAARGGLIGARHAWGNEKPTADRCDFGRFYDFVIQPMKSLPPNGYGLYAMNGGVWEWTRDWYDRDFFRRDQASHDPEGPATGEEKVLRGGSWADCADVQTVTFRMARGSSSWRDAHWGANLAPNVGFRLCRMMR